jgi:large conductance mechanosensitive channel
VPLVRSGTHESWSRATAGLRPFRLAFLDTLRPISDNWEAGVIIISAISTAPRSVHPHPGAIMLKEFREFAIKGNMIDMAVGLVIGAAFGAVVKSLVDDLLMPLVSGLIGAPDFSNIFIMLRNPTGAAFTSVKAARDAGAVVLAVGLFINAAISFLLVSMALFMVVKGVNRLRRQEPEAPPAPPSAEVQLLGEIRDLLQARR